MGCVTLACAQAAFTEQTLNEIHQAFVTNGVKAVAERTSPDFTMFGTNSVMDYAGFKARVENGGLVEWPVSDVKIKQSGNLAIAKGITKHKPKNAKAPFNQRFTETYEFQNGKWMLASAHYTDIALPKGEEEEAIKKNAGSSKSCQ